jgi:hypothetical protein
MPLVLQVYGDLPCRIVALLSGICWAEELQTSLEVYWWYLPNMAYCPFDRLFRLDSLPSWVTIYHGQVLEAEKIRSQNEFIEKKYPSVIKSKTIFYTKELQKWILHLQNLRPTFALQSRIEMVPSSSAVGIYDHLQKECRMSLVLSAIWTKYRNPKHYIISTDSEDTKRVCRVMFKQNSFFMNPQLASHTEKYALDQLVDLYTFSRCAAILDCSQSSLMQLASWIGNVPYISISSEPIDLVQPAVLPSTP